MAEFKKGDVVQLKSGGPTMTIRAISSEYGVLCQWFVGDDPRRTHFDPESLRKVEETDE